jgi:hypothetical protein
MPVRRSHWFRDTALAAIRQVIGIDWIIAHVYSSAQSITDPLNATADYPIFWMHR